MITLLDKELDYLQWVQQQEIQLDRLLKLYNAGRIPYLCYIPQIRKIQSKLDSRKAKMGVFNDKRRSN